MKHERFRLDRGTVLMIAVGAIIFLALIGYAFAENIRDAYEIASARLLPGASRDMQYGEEHFDAAKPGAYNVDLAYYFFRQAESVDPTTPYLFHELARIDFLKGRFSQAFVEINLQISMHGDSEPHAYYVRGLIEGYMGEYDASANDYAHFLQFEPDNWAAKNDEAWVLLKAKRYNEALQVTASGLKEYPSNAWLLSSNATALYELGSYQQALAVEEKAETAVNYLTPAAWSVAYPGNDPAIAAQGLATFKQAVADNMHTIQAAIASSTVQSK